MSQQNSTLTPAFTPSEKEIKILMDWFATYEGYVLKNQLDNMADMAIFPLVVMTDDSQGNCVAQSWDRETYKQAMDMTAQGVDMSTVSIESHRSPTFLNENLAVVITDAITTIAGQPQQSRYVDIMAKQDGEWRFKSMIQSGWGDMLKEYFGAS